MWKITEDELPRWNYLAGKIDKLKENENSSKLTPEETKEFIWLWWRETEPHEAFVTHVMNRLNEGDNGILDK